MIVIGWFGVVGVDDLIVGIYNDGFYWGVWISCVFDLVGVFDGEIYSFVDVFDLFYVYRFRWSEVVLVCCCSVVIVVVGLLVLYIVDLVIK